VSRHLIRALLIGAVVGAFAYHVARKLYEHQELKPVPLGSAAITMPSIIYEKPEIADAELRRYPETATEIPAAPLPMAVRAASERPTYDVSVAELKRQLKSRRAAEEANARLVETRQEVQSARAEAAQQAKRLHLLEQQKEETERQLAVAIERAATPIMPQESPPQRFASATPAAGSVNMSFSSPTSFDTTSSGTMSGTTWSSPTCSSTTWSGITSSKAGTTWSKTSPFAARFAGGGGTSDLLVSVPLSLFATGDGAAAACTAVTSVADALRQDQKLHAMILVSSTTAAAVANKPPSPHDTQETVAARYLRDQLLAAGVAGARLEIGPPEPTREMRRLLVRARTGALSGATEAKIRGTEEPAIHVVLKR
jgi:hypothetical protein